MMDISELHVYTEALEIGELVWKKASRWNFFERDTLGKQLVRAVDSVAANISEGFGRYHNKENLQFCYYARGSLYETNAWIYKAYNRGLISKEEHDTWIRMTTKLGISLNRYIAAIKRSRSNK